MDLAFKTVQGYFKYRVSAVIIHQNKLLVMHDDLAPSYYLPGGKVKWNETAEEAIVREVKEELQVESDIIRPLWLNQSFFDDKVHQDRVHELCFYFLMDISKTELLLKGEKFTLSEEGQLNEFQWVSFEDLKELNFHPAFLKEAIYHLPSTVTLMNESE